MLLIIHGLGDTLVPVEHAQRLHRAAANPAVELWLVTDAEHAHAFKVSPAAYMDRVTAFFHRHIGACG